MGRLSVGSAPTDGRALGRSFTRIYLCATDWQPELADFPGRVRRRPFRDTAQPTRREVILVFKIAGEVASDLARGETVLVTCAMGRNRSALVCALALSFLTGESAMALGRFVQRRRIDPAGVHALQNPAFWRILALADRQQEQQAAH
jgi:protein-tyrosine phosphatase